jgi:peptidoglycan/LPS O-acetylase OafA/YrhL
LHGWARFGDFSYGTYLYAFPIQQLIVHGIGHSLPAGELFMLATPPTLLCAVLSWHGVEKWFLPARPTVEPEPQYSIAFIKAVQR